MLLSDDEATARARGNATIRFCVASAQLVSALDCTSTILEHVLHELKHDCESTLTRGQRARYEQLLREGLPWGDALELVRAGC